MIISTVRAVSHTKTLLASAAQTATSTGEDAVYLSDAPNGYAFIVDLTAATSAAADTLDLFVQTKIGSFWVDVVHFTQMVGDGGALRYVSKVTAALAEAEFENGAALGAAGVRDLIGDQWRVRYVIVNDTDPSFTFSVVAIPF